MPATHFYLFITDSMWVIAFGIYFLVQDYNFLRAQKFFPYFSKWQVERPRSTLEKRQRNNRSLNRILVSLEFAGGAPLRLEGER